MKVTGDLRQRMMAALGDSETQEILSLIINESRTSSAISTELNLPISTVYRKVGQLRECGLILTDRFLVSPDGKREAVYSCAFTEIKFRPEDGGGGLGLEISLSQKALERKWFDIFFSKTAGDPDWQP